MGQKCLVFEIHLVEKPTLNRSSLAFAKRVFALRARLASLGFARNKQITKDYARYMVKIETKKTENITKTKW